MTLSTLAQAAEDPAARKAASFLAVILLGISLGTLVIVLGFVLIWRRNARHRMSFAGPQNPKTESSIDPWTEAAKRLDADQYSLPETVDPDSHTRSGRRITHTPRFDPPLPPLTQRGDSDTFEDDQHEDDDPDDDVTPGPSRTPPRHDGPSQ